MTLHGIATADVRYLCGSWASCWSTQLTDKTTSKQIEANI